MKRSLFRPFLCAALLWAACAASALAATVYIDPVEVFNAPEISSSAQGLRAMVASRVSTDALAASTTETPPASWDYRLHVTITKIGAQLSVDASLESAGSASPSVRSFETAENQEGLTKALERVTETLRTRMTAAPAVTAAQTQAAGSAQSTPAPTAPAPAATAALLEKRRVLPGISLDAETLGFAASDVDGDGLVELLFLVDRELVAFHDLASGAKEAWRTKVATKFRPRFLSVADTDGDLIPEIFLSGQADADVFTQAFLWQNGALTPHGDRVRAFLRPLTHPDKGVVLTGVPSIGGTEVFRRKLFRFAWNGTNYMEGEEIHMPAGLTPINVGWARFLAGGPVNILAVDEDNHLSIYDETGKEIYGNGLLAMGSRIRFEGEMRNLRLEEKGATWEINSAALVLPLSDGGSFVVLHDNIQSRSFLPRREGSLNNARLLAVRWDGLSLRTLSAGDEISGYFSGLAAAPGPEGKTRIYAVLVKTSGLFFTDYTSSVVVFDF